MMWHGSRRDFLRTTGAMSGLALTGSSPQAFARACPQAASPVVEVLNPRMRVPLSFIIDDSTCLVNMGRFCMPQFATAWPDRGIPEALAHLAGRDPRYVCPRIRRVVRRTWGQRKVQRRPLPCLCRLARPRASRLVPPGTQRQPAVGPRTDGAQLGHSSRNDHAHASHRSPHRPTPAGDQFGHHGERLSADSAERG